MSMILENNGLTYRLPNGTHILIHNTVAGDTMDVKPRFSVPVEEYADRNEITAEDIPTEDDWNTNATLDIASLREEMLTLPAGFSLVGNSSNSEELELDQFGEIVISFKCRSCPYLSVDRNELFHHFETCHMQAYRCTSTEQNEDEIHITAEEDSDTRRVNCDILNSETTEKMAFMCGECSAVRETLEECREHMMDNHNLILATSEDEGDVIVASVNTETRPAIIENKNPTQPVKKGRSPEKWLNTKNVVSSDNKLECTVRGCHLKFATEDVLDVHAQCHLNIGRAFQCFECAEVFPRWRACAVHLWKLHSIDPGLFSCPICHVFKTITPVKLQNHLKTHGEARPYICTHAGCFKSFKQPSQLRNHRVLHLDRKTVEVPRWYSAKKCDICLKMYADSKCLKKHIQAVHSKLRPYQCNVCGHKSARKAMLQMHHRQHTGEKPYSCNICSFKTGDHNSLRRHKMRHSGHKPYVCPHCPYAAIQSNSYKNHILKKHPGLRGAFVCAQCEFRTVNEESYVTHMKDHENGLIPNGNVDAETDFFPENEAAANMLLYKCFNGEANKWKTSVIGSATSSDGMSQTITIEMSDTEMLKGDDDDDDERYFLASHLEEEEEGVDTGGITIPAEPE